jgi:hypothetical protein
MLEARRLAGMLLFALALEARPALAEEAAPAPSSSTIVEAREAFSRGAELAKDAQWSAALASFERSRALRPHAWTTYNIGVCERALGRYARAQRTFARALEENRPGADLPETTVDDVRRFQAEIDGLVARLDVTLDPADAAIAVDGAPLERRLAAPDGRPVLVAGTLAAGPGKAPPAARFQLVLDPGSHVLLVTRDGFATAAQTEVTRPGEHRTLEIKVDRMPATVAVSASERDAVVTIDRLDVGTTPVTLQRPAGVHHVIVRKPGFDPYEIDATVKAGQRLEIAAPLKLHKPSVLTRWWFWSAAGAVVAGTVLTTYALTRPDPTRPPVDGGGLGWAVRVP